MMIYEMMHAAFMHMLKACKLRGGPHLGGRGSHPSGDFKMADFLTFVSVFCLLLSFVTQSEAVIKASQQVNIKDATFRLAKSSSFVEDHFSSESSGRGRERRDANSCAGSGRDTSPEYEIVREV